MTTPVVDPNVGTMAAARRGRLAMAPLAALLLIAALVAPSGEAAVAAPPKNNDFVVTTAFGGLTQPTDVAFGPGGRVYVAEKSGLIWTYDSIADTTRTKFLDLTTPVHDYNDRGLLAIEVHPDGSNLYALYAYNAPPGKTAPVWPEDCPNPPGGHTDGCVATGSLSRFALSAAGTKAGPEIAMIRDEWCFQFAAHPVAALEFSPTGDALYVSAGDGAATNYADYGQGGGSLPGTPTPTNPCGDPPGGAPGKALTPPTAEGGALRVQDLQTPGDPTSLNGSVLRVDPITGKGLADNPLAGGKTDDDRTIAFGMRNPFSLAARAGTDELWVGDSGWNDYDEVDLIADVNDKTIENFGWPCYEGAKKQARYAAAGVSMCDKLYAGTQTYPHKAPYWAIQHNTDDFCAGADGGDSISAMEFYDGATFPTEFKGALFLGDYSHQCIQVQYPKANGQPNIASAETVALNIGVTALEVGPDGALYAVDIIGGKVSRIAHTNGVDQPPVASFEISGSNGLTVSFDASASTDPEGGKLTYAWDFDGDGAYDDGVGVKPSFTYPSSAQLTVGLKVTDPAGGFGFATRSLTPGNKPPVAKITAPLSTVNWTVGDELAVSGTGTDAEDGALAPAALKWTAFIDHCESTTSCHTHPLTSFTGATGKLITVDHEYPSFVTLRLEVTDSVGQVATDSIDLMPRLADLQVRSDPPGVTIGIGTRTATTPFTETLLAGGQTNISAPATFGQPAVNFESWSDGGEATHNITVDDDRTISAFYGSGDRRYVPLTPTRILDTREGNGAPVGPVAPDTSMALQVGGRGGVPSEASAVVLNVTGTETTDSTYVTVYPNGPSRPLASNLNLVAGDTRANLVTAKLGPAGKVNLYNFSGNTHLVADVVGYYIDATDPGGLYHPVTPARLLDTRTSGTPVAARSSIDLDVTGSAGVPDTGVAGVIVNVTATEPTEDTFVTVWPAGVERPNASNLNVFAEKTTPNLVAAKVSAGGEISLYNHNGAAHLIVDIVGWYGDGTEADIGASAVVVSPQRLLDTRDGTGAKVGPVPTMGIIRLDLAETQVPAGATAVIMNVTATQASADTFVTVFPGGDLPLASNLNVVAGQTVPNLVVVPIGPDGSISLYNHEGTNHLVGDLVGWFA